MSGILSRMKTLMLRGGSSTQTQSLESTVRNKALKKQKSKKITRPCDYYLCMPSTARNHSVTSRPSGENKLNEKANYQAVSDYEKKYHDEISLYKNDQLIFIRSNYIDVALVKNLRTKKIGFVPLNAIIEIDDLKEKE